MFFQNFQNDPSRLMSIDVHDQDAQQMECFTILYTNRNRYADFCINADTIENFQDLRRHGMEY